MHSDNEKYEHVIDYMNIEVPWVILLAKCMLRKSGLAPGGWDSWLEYRSYLRVRKLFGVSFQGSARASQFRCAKIYLTT